MLKFKIYRTAATLEMSTWDTKIEDKKVIPVNKAIMELAPALPGNSKGQPKPGEKRYDYDKRLKISFNPTDMLLASYNLQLFASGVQLEKDFTKYGDVSKANPDKAGKRTLKMNLGDNGSVRISLSASKDEFVNIQIDKSEAYALAKWFELNYARLFNGKLGDAADDAADDGES